MKVQWLNLGLQLVSADVDGVVKIWNNKKQICQNTFEMHSDKIWAIDLNEQDDTAELITGGADSTVNLWLDNTIE